MVSVENAGWNEPRGRGPASAGTVSLDQEWPQVRRALIDVVGVRGYEQTSVEAVLERAAVDRASFERQFSGLDSVALEAWKDLAEEFMRRSDAAFERGKDWREGMRLQAWDLCRFIEEDLCRIRFMIELSTEEELVQAHRDLVMARLVDHMELGRLEREPTSDPPRGVAEGIIGAIWNGVAVSIKDPDFEVIQEGVPLILYLTMMAYLGEEAAEEELRRGPEDIARFRRGEL